jgi:hypothetical protein
MRARERGAALHMSLDIVGDCTRTRLSGRIMSYVGVAEHNHVDSVSALHSCTVAMVLSVRRRRSSRIYQDHEAHTPLVTKHQSMPDKNVRLPGRRRIPAVYDHFPPAHFQRADSTSSNRSMLMAHVQIVISTAISRHARWSTRFRFSCDNQSPPPPSQLQISSPTVAVRLLQS